MNSQTVRVIVAFLVAPLPACLIAAYLAGNYHWLLVAAPFAYLFTAMGIPIFLLFLRLGWLRFWQVVPTGAVLGGVAGFVGGFAQASLANALQFVGHGALTGLVFWLVAFAGTRPNSSFKVKPLRGSA